MAKKIVGLGVVLALVGGLTAFVYALTNNKVVIGYNEGYMPDQPIPFSHELHAGQYKMDCKYCHTSVEESRHASIPSLNVCMNLKLQVKVAELDGLLRDADIQAAPMDQNKFTQWFLETFGIC